jgi:hypothetical protein
MKDSGCAIISSAICLAFGGRSGCNSRTRDRIPFTDGPALKFDCVTRALANNVGIHLVDRPEHESAVPVAMSMADRIRRTRTARQSRLPALSPRVIFEARTWSRFVHIEYLLGASWPGLSRLPRFLLRRASILGGRRDKPATMASVSFPPAPVARCSPSIPALRKTSPAHCSRSGHRTLRKAHNKFFRK